MELREDGFTTLAAGRIFVHQQDERSVTGLVFSASAAARAGAAIGAAPLIGCTRHTRERYYGAHERGSIPQK
jgi:hypothetical protein